MNDGQGRGGGGGVFLIACAAMNTKIGFVQFDTPFLIACAAMNCIPRL